MKRAKYFLAITCITVLSQVSLANIPDRQKSVDWEQTEVVPTPPSLFTKYFSKYVPPNLTPTTNSLALGQEIETKGIQKITDDFMNGDFFQKSVAGKAIHSVQKAADKSISFGDAAKHEIVHKFQFQFRAIGRSALIDYTGFFTSHIIYNLDTSVANISVTKPLNNETSLSLENSTNIYQAQLNPTLTFTHNF